MTNHEKITVQADWDLSNRTSIVNATYRQALTYLCQLRRRFSTVEFNLKPYPTKLYRDGVNL